MYVCMYVMYIYYIYIYIYVYTYTYTYIYSCVSVACIKVMGSILRADFLATKTLTALGTSSSSLSTLMNVFLT